jgi:hypothetical protein
MKKLNRRRLAGIVAILTAILAAGLGGGAGQAAPGITLTFEPLIGAGTNEIPKVSYGRGIGFHLFAKNDGTNSTPQTSIVVTSSSATFDTAAATFNGGEITCAAAPGNNKQMVCPLPGGTLAPGDTFDAFFRFIAPTSTAITQVSTTAALSVAAQTVGSKKNKGTSLSSSTLLTDLVSDTTIDNAYLRQSEQATTEGPLTSTHPQNFTLNTPAGLLNAFGVAVGIQDRVETLADPCVGLLSSCTTLTIPAAHFVGTETPFGLTAPYTWSMNAAYTGGFTLHGVVHVDDANIEHTLPSCASLAGGTPTADDPLCYDTLEQITNKKMLKATGKGLENGGLGWN